MSRSLLPFAAPFALLAASPALAVDETFDTQGPAIHVQPAADGRDPPSGLAFLPDGGMPVTARRGDRQRRGWGESGCVRGDVGVCGICTQQDKDNGGVRMVVT